MLITDAYGQKVRLKELGTLDEGYNPPSIERKSKQRMLKVSVTPASGYAMGDIAVAAQKVIDKMDVPSEYSIYIGGSYEDQQESFSALFLLIILSLLLVYLVMAAEFESFVDPASSCSPSRSRSRVSSSPSSSSTSISLSSLPSAP